MINKRNQSGSTLHEFPAAMYFLFVGLLIPCIGLVTFGYRAALAFFVTRDAAYKAAKSQTFTLAQVAANTAWKTDLKAFPNIGGTETPYIVTHPLNGGKDSLSASPLPTVDTQNNMYFIRIVSHVFIPPFFGGTWLGQAIPGLTTAYPLQASYQYYAENPQGLTK